MSKFKTIPSIRAQMKFGLSDISRDVDVVIAEQLPDKPLEKGRADAPGPPAVPPWLCHIVLASAQIAFTIGSVYLKSSMRYVDTRKGEVFSPIIYVFLREILAAPVMSAIAHVSTRTLPRRKDVVQIMVLGLCLYMNQLFFILGINLSGVVVATCMQPAIPVFTVLLAVLFGMEHGSLQKVVGIILAVAGSICMVLGGASGDQKSLARSRDLILGNMCLLANTLSMALYFLATKLLVAKYPPVCISAWAYVGASVLMGVTSALFVDRKAWSMPPALLGPLIYWVFVVSVTGYYIVAWATHYLPASQVAAFVCLQPFLGTLLAFLVLGEQPSVWDLGALGILFGLLLVTTDKADKTDRTAVAQLLARMRRLVNQAPLATLVKPERE